VPIIEQISGPLEIIQATDRSLSTTILLSSGSNRKTTAEISLAYVWARANQTPFQAGWVSSITSNQAGTETFPFSVPTIIRAEVTSVTFTIRVQNGGCAARFILHLFD